jgi:histone chaperone ASF1
MVGPVPQGVSKFVLTAEAPDTNLIPLRDLVGVTVGHKRNASIVHSSTVIFMLFQVVLVTCAYREKEFVRIG